MVALILCSLLCLIAVAMAVIAVPGNRKLARLVNEAPSPPDVQPLVSIVVAARNEAATIGPALRTMLLQDYGHYEIWVVNDRSEDATGQILAEMCKEYPKLNVLTIDQLPPGWLGKNNALHQGAKRAGGDIILFTDADVVMEKTTLSRAVGYMTRHSVEHLVLSPKILARGLGMNSFLNFAAMIATVAMQPWRVRDPKSSQSIGAGAFNMVRREAYERVGGHQSIPLRPDDDFVLGRVLKKAGVRQDYIFGQGLVEVEWYPSLPALVKGTEKNLFALHYYRMDIVIAETLMMLALFCSPFFLMWYLPGLAGWLCAATAGVLVLTNLDNARFYHCPPIYSLVLPLGVVVSLCLTWNSALRALQRGGIVWRGTQYSLAELRKNTVP